MNDDVREDGIRRALAILSEHGHAGIVAVIYDGGEDDRAEFFEFATFGRDSAVAFLMDNVRMNPDPLDVADEDDEDEGVV